MLLLILAGAVAALALLYGVRMLQKSPSATVSALLPRETIAFVHLPDFNRSRNQWRQSDIYQLYREPSVQEFLRKPLTKVLEKDATSQTLREIEQLDPEDAFVAVTSIDYNNPKVVGGFRFKGRQEDAEKIIERWRARLLTQNRAAQREQLQDGRHQIDSITVAPFTLATVFDGDWFFVANDLSELKAILYRAGHRTEDRQSTLEADHNFHAAMAHMPANYAISFYLQPKTFANKLAALRAADGSNLPPDQRPLIEQIHSICGATRLEGGKIHDVVFVGMSQLETTKLTRSSLAFATKDTFFYLAMLLNLGRKLDALQHATGGAAVTAGWQRTLHALAKSGVTAEDWRSAFGVELGALADWPEGARWPSLFITFPVKDTTKATKMVETLVGTNSDGAVWTQTEKDGVHYFSKVSVASLAAITPTIGLSNRIMIAGVDPVSVEEAMKRGEAESSELGSSVAYTNAAQAAPEPTNYFAYIDVPLLYSRVDATLRPMLFLSAAFLPWVADYVDVKKLPPAEVVTKHLSPVVSSQRYDGDGYVADSVGSITLNQSGAGLGALGVLGSIAYRRGLAASLDALAPAASPASPATPTPANRTPFPTPKNTP
jgi:hypothetical protein